MKIPQKILITGASSGVGRSLAEHYADDYHLIVAARRLQRLENQFGNRKNSSVYQVDLSNPEETGQFTELLIEQHGYVPYVINNAGVNHAGDMAKVPIQAVSESLRVNGMAPLHIMKRLLEPMRENNFGRIINITSGAPLNCFPGYGAYSSSKAFLNAVTVTTAKEHADYNIKINLMSPGPVRSEMSPDSELDPEVCHPTADYLLNLDEEGATGKFFWLGHEVPLFPDLEGVQWLEGKGNEKLRKIF